LGLRKTIWNERKKLANPRFERKETRFDKLKSFQISFQGRRNQNKSDKQFRPKNKSNKTYAEQTEEIEKSELDRRKAAGECQRCAWPGDSKGAHKTMECFRWARKETGTSPFPKAKEYQKLKIGAYRQEEEEEEIDLYPTDDGSQDSEEDSEEEEDSEQEADSDEEEESQGEIQE